MGAASWTARTWLGWPGLEHDAPADLLVYSTDPRGGPDVLSACFEDESVMGFALEVKAAACSFCGYNLRGLAMRGRCPECGSLYDIGGGRAEDIA